jgi:6-methylsalicylate decarboxylase
MTEYPFDSVRAIENLLFTGQRKEYGSVRIIFPHGGGAVPFVAARIAGQAGVASGGAVNATETMAQLRGYFFDLASATSAPQLWALRAFYGGDVSRIVLGTDCEFVCFHAQVDEAGIVVVRQVLTRFSPRPIRPRGSGPG